MEQLDSRDGIVSTHACQEERRGVGGAGLEAAGKR